MPTRVSLSADLRQRSCSLEYQDDHCVLKLKVLNRACQWRSSFLTDMSRSHEIDARENHRNLSSRH